MLCNEQLQKAWGIPNVQSYTTLHVIYLFIHLFRKKNYIWQLPATMCFISLFFILHLLYNLLSLSFYNNPRDAANKVEFCNLTILWDEQQWGQINKVIKSIGMLFLLSLACFCIGIIFSSYSWRHIFWESECMP